MGQLSQTADLRTDSYGHAKLALHALVIRLDAVNYFCRKCQIPDTFSNGAKALSAMSDGNLEIPACQVTFR